MPTSMQFIEINPSEELENFGSIVKGNNFFPIIIANLFVFYLFI